MLRLLTENPSLSDQLKTRFDYIFVDEYQDINAVQEAIIDKVRADDNVFVVGDVKQSIYAFRQSRPQIFLKRLTDAVDVDDKDNLEKPLRVDLSDNFRSRPEILNFANELFSRIMIPSIAGMEYDQRCALTSGLGEEDHLPVDPARPHPVEMHILDEQVGDTDDGDDDSAEDDSGAAGIISAAQRQASCIARRIRDMVGVDSGKAEFKVYDKSLQQTRDVGFGDIAVLLRSVSSRAREYVEVFRLAGIPVRSQSSSGYFAATEIADMLCVLKVLDNPRRDIELAAVLRSAMFGFTDTDLTRIRANAGRQQQGDKISYYEAVVAYSNEGECADLRQRLVEALARLNQWRQKVRHTSLAELICDIYRQTGYPAFVSALVNGQQRKANLLRLHDRAIQFEHFGRGNAVTSLTRFVEFIEQLLEEDQDWAPAETNASAANSVRLMSIHKSKGLEFPVVFIAELNRKFSKKDLTADCVADEDFALGLRVIDPDSGARVSGPLHELATAKRQAVNLAEEMRILYVAVTRAREKLILCGAGKIQNCKKIVTQCAALAGHGLFDWQLKGCSNHLDWLLFGLGNQRRLQKALAVESPEQCNDQKLFDVEVVDRSRLDEISSAILDIRTKRSAEPVRPPSSGKFSDKTTQTASQIRQSLSWVYPGQAATQMQAKYSVSELSHRDDEYANRGSTDALGKVPLAIQEQTDVPATRDRKLQAGSAAHMLIQHLNLKSPITSGSIESTARSLVEHGMITVQSLEAVDLEAIGLFFESPVGLASLNTENTVLREWPFTCKLDGGQLDPAAAGEIVVLQGIIDMIVKTPEGLLIVDFKTDRVDTDTARHRAQLYREQMKYYCRAATAILKSPLAGCQLYFLNAGSAVEMPPD